MELIIKPTGRCNFDCTFCSASGLNIAHPENGVPNVIKKLINVMHPNGIIVTGGEPLTVDPNYYLELQEIAKCHISFTSNMKDFYLHPDKWTEVIRNPNFGFITSFNYGNTRRWDPHTPYTEEMFIKVHELFKTVSGRDYLPFIAVIDESNEDTIMDHIHLARSLGSKVKINGACKIGLQDHSYPRYKILKAYIDIIDAGLGEYEMTCCERHLGKCPFNINMLCKNTIRACYVDTAGKLHYGNCEDLLSAGEEIMMDSEFPIRPIPVPPPRVNYIKKDCINCELFRLCHGCRAQLKYAGEFEDYCEEMLKLKDSLVRQGWAM